MKWRNEEGKRQDEAKTRKPGDTRGIKKFAWKPVEIDGDTVWLESYYVIQKWSEDYKYWYICGKSVVWD